MRIPIDKTIQEMILQLTGLTEAEYNERVYNTAESYMDGFAPKYPQVVKQIMQSSIFWNWWQKHWEARDREFIETWDGMGESKENLLDFYNETHDWRTLVEAVYLSGQVLEQSYAEMFGKVAKEQRKEVAA
jgi:hypothetical protein